MQPGDILLCRVIKSSSWSSKFISWGQHVLNQAPSVKNYCHVAMVDYNTDYLLEAKFPFTRKWLIDWDHMDSHYGTELWRVKNITPEQVKQTLDWAHAHLGEWYDLPIFLDGIVHFKDTEVCSTYTQHSFEVAGIELSVEGAGKVLTTPDEIGANTSVIELIAVSKI